MFLLFSLSIAHARIISEQQYIMGNQSCMEVCRKENQNQQIIQQQIVQKVHRHTNSGSIESNENSFEDLRNIIASSFVRTPLAQSDNIIKLKVLDRDFSIRQIVFPRDFDQKNEEHLQENYCIYSVKLFENQQAVRQKRVQIFIVSNVQEHSEKIKNSIYIFCGQYENGSKKHGVHFTFTKQESFVFIGEFNGEYNIGLKVKLNQNNLHKHWGHFNAQFIAEGSGKQFKQNGQFYEYHQGNYKNGIKDSRGILKMKRKTEFDRSLVDPGQRSTKCQVIKTLKNYLTSVPSNVDIRLTAIKLISNFSSYDPSFKAISFGDQQCDLIFESSWKNGKMEGFTKQVWPQKHVRFEGMFKDNERHGYGEEYIYDNIKMKGFYRDGMIQYDRNSRLLLGFRFNQNEQWIRQPEKV